MRHFLYPLLYAVTLSAVSLLVNWVILLPWFLHRQYPINMLSVTVYAICFCLKYVSLGAASIGLVLSLGRFPQGWKAHLITTLILSLLVLCVQAYYFPRS